MAVISLLSSILMTKLGGFSSFVKSSLTPGDVIFIISLWNISGKILQILHLQPTNIQLPYFGLGMQKTVLPKIGFF